MSATQLRAVDTTVPGAARPARDAGIAGAQIASDLRAIASACVGRVFGPFAGRPFAGWLRAGRTSLALDCDDAVLRFPSHREFEFALAARTEPPAARVAQMEQLTLFELRRMATDIRRLEHRCSDVLAASMDRGRGLGRLLQQLELKSFTNDHDWRAIFGALAQSSDTRHDPYRHVALAKYMQYLRNRQALIQHIYAARSAERETAAVTARVDVVAPSSMSETAIFDFRQTGNFSQSNDFSQTARAASRELSLLPRGESIGVTVARGESVDLMLATYPFQLTSGDQLNLVDVTSGETFRLRTGRNTIGRGQSCDIPINRNHREVSRKHLVIDCIDSCTVVCTDLSSHGTRVSASRVIGARPAEMNSMDLTKVGVGPAPVC